MLINNTFAPILHIYSTCIIYLFYAIILYVDIHTMADTRGRKGRPQ